MGDNKKVANGVVALGSAAVMAVYGAGYAKTQAAADRFAQQAAERRPHIPAARGDDEASALALDAPAPAAPETALVEPRPTDTVTAAAASESKPAALNPAVEKPVAEARAVAATPKAAKTEAPADTAAAAPAAAATVAPAAGEDEEPAVPVQTAAAQAPAPAPAPVPAPAPAPAPPVAAPAAPAKATYKDGTFYGWGTSRHGDIQAAVVIENGRITVARVERCLTRYSCNWIVPIPPRILAKQGTTYDYVSGATESSDAFQDAVSEALSTAK